MKDFVVALDEFFAQDDKKILMIKGKWGVGKTYYWKEFVASKTKKKQLKENIYSYVSLFGAKDLNSVREQIFENGTRLKDDNTIKNSFKNHAGTLTSLIKLLPGASEYDKVISKIAYAAINNYLICFDDLERKLESLTISEILGLASILKEEKNCRIVFILNEDELKEKDIADLNTYRERVVDVELIFNPTLIDNFNLVFDSNNQNYDFLLDKVKALDLRNIRILLKIKWNIDYVKKAMTEIDLSLQELVFSDIILISYAHYNSGFNISIEFLKTRNPMHMVLRSHDDVDDITKEKDAFLTTYGYYYADFDEYLIEFIRNGILNRKEFLKLLLPLNDKEKASKISDRLRAIYRLYNGSFKASESEFINSLFSFLDQYSTKIGLKEFYEIEMILKDLGKDVNKYRETVLRANLDSLSLVELESLLRHPFTPSAFNKEIQDKIDQKRTDFDVSKIFAKIINEKSWGGRETEFLASCDVDDFYDWILEEDDGYIVSYVRQGLQFKKSNDPAYAKIGENIEEALKKVANGSEFNRIRIKNLFNITVPTS